MMKMPPVEDVETFKKSQLEGLKNNIKQFLLSKEFNPAFVGFDYLIVALMFTKQEIKKNKHPNTTYDIYPTVASKFNTTVTNVERNIRYLIQSSCYKGQTNKRVIYKLALEI